MVIKRKRDNKNRLTWPLIAAKFIIEILIHRTPPTTVVKILESTIHLTFPQIKIEKLPTVDCYRKSR